MSESPPPIVLCLSGHDPSGGAGLHADIEAILALGCRPASVLTALTHQDSRNAYAVHPCPATAVGERLQLLLDDLPIAAVKIGLLGEPAQAQTIAGILKRHATIPVVLDPVLVAGGGAVLAEDPVRMALLEHLLPLTEVVTPNIAEARALSGAGSTDAQGAALLKRGAGRVLITGGDTDQAETVVNHLYAADAEPRRFEWRRLPHRYHGSGCTLSSAIAALLARGETPQTAIEQAQEYTWQCLVHGYRPGRGQHYPDRLYYGRSWLDEG